MRPPAASLRPPFVDLDRVAAGVRTAADVLERSYRVVLAALVVAQWGVVLWIALAAQHHGWLYHHGGDGTWYWTAAYELGHFRLPYTAIGYGYSYLVAPFGAVLGPNMLDGLPPAILLNTLILLPTALLLLYGVGERIAGRRFGLLAAALWVVLPLLAYRGFRAGDARPAFLDLTLPGSFGLTGTGDFPSMVTCLAGAYLALRTIATRAATDAALCGIVTAFAIGIKPANALFMPAPILAFALARRRDAALPFVAGLILPLLALASWKYRGLGQLPLLRNSFPAVHLAAGDGPIVAGAFGHYGGIDLHLLGKRLAELREIFWSRALVEWVAIAGTFGLLRRSFVAGAAVSAWFWAYLLVKGTSPYASVYSMTFFRLVEPAYPAFVLLTAAAIALLLPQRRGERERRAPRPIGRRLVIAAAVVLGVLPLVLASTARPIAAKSTARSVGSGVDLVVASLGLQARVDGDAVRLRWNGDGTFRLFRTPPVGDGDCTPEPGGVPECYYVPGTSRIVSGTSATDRPEPGTWYYRVAPIASANGHVADGDPLLLSEPVTVTVP